MNNAASSNSLDRPPCFLAAEEIELESGKAYYSTRGDGGPWLMTYTLGSSSELYLPALLDSLSRYARIILVRWPDTPSYHAAIHIGVDVMNHLGVDCAVWYGSSIGGALAQGASAFYPQRVAGLVLANTALPVPWARGLVRLTRRLLSMVPERSIKKRLLRSIGDLTDTSQATRTAELLTKQDILNWLRWAADFHGSKLHKSDSRGAKKPTLIIESDNDPGVPAAHRRRLLEGYPHASKVTFEGGGHFPHLKFGQEYCEAIVRFMRQES